MTPIVYREITRLSSGRERVFHFIVFHFEAYRTIPRVCIFLHDELSKRYRHEDYNYKLDVYVYRKVFYAQIRRSGMHLQMQGVGYRWSRERCSTLKSNGQVCDAGRRFSKRLPPATIFSTS